MKDKSEKKPSTLLTHSGRAGASHFGAVNPPVYHASTILFDSYADIINNRGITPMAGVVPPPQEHLKMLSPASRMLMARFSFQVDWQHVR